ncbi:nicotinate-nucleotide--dimethylbenzimidazole phosphoribosyltransferase [Streptomyces sp. DG2A-72]|uniref:nicotinate-nucleotide--dimethylbenzimidazole phosphoribosyltransferase n=1 Tax=Streptomyces sp. DG2A-72 TaxID=3051386 RepID=UPI00265C74B0|nr:nicotinate-nucleotide--dimethylbenzimidazole phosphoribosyltransferase [Streptomyces sp. DG2A-72]MDO0931637.1 nicotinate-nucleotide--dimethylbenzimidazole phosphoribosyltransferase [Streptomyces sp. DG2A-72]
MTDTGQVPGEGLPESAGMVEQPGAPAHGAYTYLSETTAEDEDLLLLPGAQGAWGNEVPPPAPEPVVEAVHEPGPHETAGRDSGNVDLSGVRLPTQTMPSTPATTHRRPLHLGPPTPDQSASPVRSLADRGPAGAPAGRPGPYPTGPEYLDVPQLREAAPQGASPWGAPAPGTVQAPAHTEAAPAETVVPTAEPAVAHFATEAIAVAAPRMAEAEAGAYGVEGAEAAPIAEGVEAAEGGEASYGAEAVPGSDGGYGADGGPDPTAPAVSAGAVGPEAGPVPTDTAGSNGEVPGASAPEAVGTAGPQAGAAPEGAPAAEGGQAAGAEFESGGDAGPVTEGLPVPDAGQVLEGPAVPDAGQMPEYAAVPDAGQMSENAAVPDAGQLPDGPVTPDAGQVAEAPSAPEADSLPGMGVAPDAAQAPMTVTAPDAGLPEAGHLAEVVAPQDAGQTPEVVPTPETAVPEPAHAPEPAAPEPAHASDPAAPTTTHAPDPAVPESVSDPDPALSAPGPQTPESAMPFPAAPEAAQPLPPADVEIPAQDPHEQPVADAQHTQGPQHATPHTPLVAAQPETPDVVAAEAHGMAVGTPMDDAEAPQPLAAEDVTPAELVDEQVQFEGAAAGQDGDVTGTFPAAGVPEEPMGQFVPVEGSVPTTPHLAPTPPQALQFPADDHQESPVVVPAPRDGDAQPAAAEPDPELVQHAEDLDTRAADLEESTAVVAETPESTGPAAPAYEDAEREAVLKVMRERRDIRNGFRSDPIPHEVLLRVLEAAHTAPSVGHSQPWDFVVIRSADTRRTMHELAMRQRDAYAKSLPKGRAKQFKELKIEAILDTPVNIVVTADPTRGGRHTLGRHTQPQMAPYSSALAVENLWLAARAEGLGVGWVSFFDEREMVRTLGLPEHLEVVAYLCVGYVDEFPEEPELMQAGWSKRRPLSWVVHEETYGRRALPGEDPHDLLAETVAQIRPLDAKALGEAWERQKRMTKPPGSLGMLEIISAQLSGLSRQCPPPIPEPAAVAIFAGDHGVHAQGVTPWPQEVTAQMVANFLGGGAVCNAFAGQVGAEVCVVDVGVAADLPATPGLLPRKVRAGTSDMTTGPAMTREEAKQAIEVGIETARDLVAAGNKALLTGEMGIANTTASAALISVFTDTDPAEVTGRGTGINDETLARKTEVVRRAIDVHQPDPADPIGVLAAIGGFEHAAIVGLLLGGASLRTPVILDGVSAGAAALVARAIAPEVLAACIAGHRSAEPGHVAALNKLGLRPLVDLDLRLGEGTGALLALPLVQSTARAMHEVATFDSAGVTEK